MADVPGVMGLRQLVQRKCRTQFMALCDDGEAAHGGRTAVVVDGLALLAQHVNADPALPAADAPQVYLVTHAFFAQLVRLGFAVTLVVEGAGTQALQPHEVELGAVQALAAADAGATVVQAPGTAAHLCARLARAAGDGLFAVVSDNTDLLVLNVPRVAFVSDVTLGPAGVCWHLLDVPACWAALRTQGGFTAPAFGAPPAITALQLAQVAAVMGSAQSTAARLRLARRGVAPTALVMQLLARASEPLAREFFTTGALKLTFEGWSDREQASLQAAVDHYVALDAAPCATDGAPYQAPADLRARLLPNVAAQPVAQAMCARCPPDNDDREFPDVRISVGGLLSREELDSHDASDLIRAYRTSQSFKIQQECQRFDVPNPDPAKPALYSHQAQLFDTLAQHLQHPRRPLHVIYSTPTGSGKTFSAVMLYRQLLEHEGRGPSRANPNGQPGRKLMVYSCPTKNVLLRVGREVVAGRIAYWIITTVLRRVVNGDQEYLEEHFELRRPYAIRKAGAFEKKNVDELPGPTMKEQLEYAIHRGRAMGDVCGGRPEMIVADYRATAALMELAHTPEAPAEFRAHNLVLFYDEPNMGLHVDRQTHDVTRRIIQHLPQTAILASATLPSWTELPAYWINPTAQLAVVTRLPHDLPVCELANFDLVDQDNLQGALATTSLLELFATYEGFQRHFGHTCGSESRLLTLLMRHLSAAQLQSLGLRADVEDLADFRQNVLVPRMAQLTREQFEQLRWNWLQKSRPNSSLRDITATNPGVAAGQNVKRITLVASQHPRTTAINLTGFGSEEFHQQERKVRRRVQDARANLDKAESQQNSSTKGKLQDKDDKAAPIDLSELRSVKIGKLLLDVAEAEAMDDETLVLLSRGIVYAGEGAPAAMMIQFNRTVMNVGEDRLLNADKAPPLYVLVVDYASIYGLDCPAIDTLVLFEDLGRHLTPDDLLQFLGRLRQGGRAIFMSHRTQCRAVLRATAVMDDWQPEFERQVRAILEAGPAPKTDATAVNNQCRDLRKLCYVTGAATKPRAELFRLVAQHTRAFEPPAAGAAFEPWRKLHPWAHILGHETLGLAAVDNEQLIMLHQLQDLFLAADPGAWAKPADTAMKLLNYLYQQDVASSSALQTWWQAVPATTRHSHPCAAPINELMHQLAEEDDEEDDDDDEDDE